MIVDRRGDCSTPVAVASLVPTLQSVRVVLGCLGGALRQLRTSSPPRQSGALPPARAPRRRFERQCWSERDLVDFDDFATRWPIPGSNHRCTSRPADCSTAYARVPFAHQAARSPSSPVLARHLRHLFHRRRVFKRPPSRRSPATASAPESDPGGPEATCGRLRSALPPRRAARGLSA